MTDKDKNNIATLRQSGLGYTKIAQRLGLPVSTVKSHCLRNRLMTNAAPSSCQQCGKPIEPQQGRREKKFCSAICRMKWWNSHTGLMKENAVCAHCGKPFHGRAGRKYCCHACYIAERFGERHVS